MIEDGIDVNTASPEGYTALHYAAHGYFETEEVHKELAQFLLDRGANTEALAPVGRIGNSVTPLMIACHCSLPSIVRVLVDAGADVNEYYEGDLTPMRAVFDDGCYGAEIFRILADAGADVNSMHMAPGSPLINAILRVEEDAMAVATLLELGADVNLSADSFSPLHYAARADWQDERVGCMRILINAGADLEARDARGKTPLAVAAEEGYFDRLPPLVEAGANIEARDKDGMTVLMLAANQSGDPFKKVKVLLEKGADPKASSDSDDRTALDYAKRYLGWFKRDRLAKAQESKQEQNDPNDEEYDRRLYEDLEKTVRILQSVS
jgi:ankyrin repeat protein